MNKHLFILIIFWIQGLLVKAQDFQEYYDLGKTYYKEHKFDSAIMCFDRAIEIDSNVIKLYLNRAKVYEITGNLSEALNDYNKIICLDSMYGRAYQGRANIYMKTNRRDKEIQDYKKAIELLPNDEKTYYSYIKMGIHIIEDNGNSDTAIQYINKAIDLTKKFKYFTGSSCYYERGKVYFKKGEYQKAIDDFTTAIDLGLNCLNCYLMRSDAYKKLGLIDKAKKDQKKYEKVKIENDKKKKNTASNN